MWAEGNVMSFRLLRTLVFAVAALCISGFSVAQVGVMITIAPPALPIYDQPVCPGDGYLWTPGYWAWDDSFDDYYWVPGTWVMAPEVGFLWTPPYWGWGGDRFIFHDGWWGPQIGFYGGINYGFGYFGVGFVGGRWDNGHFFYNREVMNVNVTEIHNVYNTRVEINNNNHVSFNGGNGGVDARPRPEEEAAEQGRHIPAVAAQTQHIQEARSNPQLRASENRGRPSVAATSRPGDFKGGAVQAKEAGGTYNPPANRGGNRPSAENQHPENQRPENQARTENGQENNASRPAAGHVRDLPPAEKPAAPNTGDPKLDKKYQQQQDKQYAQQQKERQKLSQQQEKEDQKVAKQNNDSRKQQVEQQHQQQTQQLQQRHQQQQQQMQQRMQPRAQPASKPH
jgi:hypothetical protein